MRTTPSSAAAGSVQLDLLGERAVDIVVDPVGGDRMTDSLRSLAPEGRLLVLGFSAGEISLSANLG